jgi:rhomboid family GlyGly-CTERM serine protease
MLTGHFTHWNANHVAWDLAAFLGLGALVEWRSRRLLVTTVLASALAISAVVWWAEPQLTSYRGLSGVDTALFASVIASLLRGATEQRDWRAAIVPALAIVGAVAKFAFEAATQSTVFVAASMEFVAVPSAHLAGAAVGLVAGISRAGARAKAGWNAGATLPSDAIRETATPHTTA